MSILSKLSATAISTTVIIIHCWLVFTAGRYLRAVSQLDIAKLTGDIHL